MPLYRAIATRGFGALPAGGGGGAIASPTLAVADLGNGTGATATITGSESGSVTNDVYVGSWSGASSVTFALETTRTGNGTASLTLTTGYYWAYVESTDGASYSVSNLVYFVVTDSTDPIHDQCARAAQAVIQGLTLEGLTSDQIVVRKFPHLRKEDERPFVIISTHLPVSTSPATNLRDDVMYPVTVNFWAQSNSDLTTNQERMLKWREQVRRAFHQQRLSGVDSVWQCQIPNSQPFNEAWFLSAQKDYSALTLNFISRESRD